MFFIKIKLSFSLDYSTQYTQYRDFLIIKSMLFRRSRPYQSLTGAYCLKYIFVVDFTNNNPSLHTMKPFNLFFLDHYFSNSFIYLFYNKRQNEELIIIDLSMF